MLKEIFWQGKTKVEVARMIQNKSDEVVISYNKLHAEPKQGGLLLLFYICIYIVQRNLITEVRHEA